jgi:excisionase family DNA binding protein
MYSKDTVGVYEFARLTGLSLAHVYNQLRIGRLPGEKVGPLGAWRIPKSAIAPNRKKGKAA